MDAWMCEWLDGCMAGWLGVRGLCNVWMDRWMDGLMVAFLIYV